MEKIIPECYSSKWSHLFSIYLRIWCARLKFDFSSKSVSTQQRIEDFIEGNNEYPEQSSTQI